MTARKYRNPNPATVQRSHALLRKELGRNRFQPGQYTCSCGETFSGINAYEKHRARERKAEKTK